METKKTFVSLSLQEVYENHIELELDQDINQIFCDWGHEYTCCPAVIDTHIGDAEERDWVDKCTIQQFVDNALTLKYN